MSTKSRVHHLLPLAAAALVGTLPGCGSSNTVTGSTQWKSGVFEPSTTFANQCVSPRSGIDPSTGKAYLDKPGSKLTENNFLRSWTNDIYLWYGEVPDLDPSGYETANYFTLLKTNATTPSGNPKDRFHFTYTTAEWFAFSESGVEAGYGAQFASLSSRPPRRVVVALVDPGTPAEAAGLARGAQILTVDGADLVNANDQASVDKLNAGLSPHAGTTHTFSVQDLGGAVRTVTMTAANVTSTPVQNVRTFSSSAGRVGYMLFNDHIATSEPLLVSAFQQLAAAGVQELVLDLRYNGGGYLAIASEVAYMIAGSATSGHGFERTVWNDKHPTTDPYSGDALTALPFLSTTQGLGGTQQGQALPTLNLSRVAVLTGGGTCSASESIINSLRGIGIEVIQVGATTCGKPYGFYPQDNCGTTYFTIMFKGVNDQGFGDYPDGFSPANAGAGAGVALPGCAVADDFGHALGDPNEGRLQAAVGYLTNRSCPAVSGTTVSAASGPDLMLLRSPLRENRIYGRRR